VTFRDDFGVPLRGGTARCPWIRNWAFPALGEMIPCPGVVSCCRAPKESLRRTQGFLKESLRKNARGVGVSPWPILRQTPNPGTSLSGTPHCNGPFIPFMGPLLTISWVEALGLGGESSAWGADLFSLAFRGEGLCFLAF